MDLSYGSQDDDEDEDEDDDEEASDDDGKVTVTLFKFTSMKTVIFFLTIWAVGAFLRRKNVRG